MISDILRLRPKGCICQGICKHDTLKFMSIHNPLKFYGVPGLIFLIIGLSFIAWTIQIYSVEQEIITNISLIGIGCVVLGSVFLMTAVILFSIVTVVKER